MRGAAARARRALSADGIRARAGSQAGEARLREVLIEAGYGAVRRVAENDFNVVITAQV